MATRNRTTGTAPAEKASTIENLPAAWGTEPVEQFEGHDLTDKAALVGTPFLIIGAEVERNAERGYDRVYVYALDVNGTEFEFADTSKNGVKLQVQEMLAERGLNPAPDGGFQALRVACMKGLRISEFEFEDQKTGKTRDANTYYIHGAGRNHSDS